MSFMSSCCGSSSSWPTSMAMVMSGIGQEYRCGIQKCRAFAFSLDQAEDERGKHRLCRGQPLEDLIIQAAEQLAAAELALVRAFTPYSHDCFGGDGAGYYRAAALGQQIQGLIRWAVQHCTDAQQDKGQRLLPCSLLADDRAQLVAELLNDAVDALIHNTGVDIHAGPLPDSLLLALLLTQYAILQAIGCTRMGAAGLPFALQGQVQLLAKLAHPANLFGRHSYHQRISWHVLVDHRAGAYEGVLANSHAAYNGAVGAQGGAFFDQGVAVLVLAFDQRPGVVDVGEDHAGAAEYALFKGNIVIDRDVILHLAVIADNNPITDKDVLS